MLKYMIGIDAGGTHSTAIAYDENGKEIEVNDGNTWINICPIDSSVTFE